MVAARRASRYLAQSARCAVRSVTDTPKRKSVKLRYIQFSRKSCRGKISPTAWCTESAMHRIWLAFCLLLAACSQSDQRPVVIATAPAASTSRIAPQLAAPAIASAPKRATAPAATTSDQEIARLLVARSIAAYPGSCPCPENLDRAGRRCGSAAPIQARAVRSALL